MTARSTYHENNNSCWDASEGAIAFALDAGANRIDFSILTKEGEEFFGLMLRRQAAKAAESEPVKKNKMANTIRLNENYHQFLY